MGYTLRDTKEEQEIWVAYGPEPTEEERKQGKKQEGYGIRPLRPKHLDHFRTMATRFVWQRGQKVEELDRKRYNELLADHLIGSWEGVFFDDECTQPVPCTLEYKVMLMANSLERANFLVDQGTIFANDDDARKRAERDSFRAVSQA